MKFVFMSGYGTTNAISILRQLQEKYLAKKKNFYFGYVNLEKAFDQVDRDVVWWEFRRLSVQEWLVKFVSWCIGFLEVLLALMGLSMMISILREDYMKAQCLMWKKLTLL